MQTILTFLPYFQVGISIILIALILLQRSDSDAGSAFGGDGNVTRYSRRGLERTLFNLTIIAAVLFAASSLLTLVQS